MSRYAVLSGLAVVVLTGTIVTGADWPQWRGPARDGLCTETGLLKKWPAGGPKLLWTVKGLGKGYSTVSVVGDTLYTTGYDGSKGNAFAIGTNGKVAWKKPYGTESKRGKYIAARTTPTFDEGKLYVFTSDFQMVCLNAKTGKTVWAIDTKAKFGGRDITWNPAESPLIDGEKVICTPGGESATMVALNKNTGKLIWKSTGIRDKSAYCSPIIIERGGRKQYCTVVSDHVIGVDAETGKCLWKHPFKNRFSAHPNTPIYSDGLVWATAGYDHGSVCLELNADGSAAKVKWTDKTLDIHHGNCVLVDGHLYGANWDGNSDGKWVCMELATGKVKWEQQWNCKGSIRYADGMLYLYDEKQGGVALVRATPAKFDLVSSFKVPRPAAVAAAKAAPKGPKSKGRSRSTGEPFWAHPVIANGVLYLRHADRLMAYDIKGK